MKYSRLLALRRGPGMASSYISLFQIFQILYNTLELHRSSCGKRSLITLLPYHNLKEL